MSKYIALEQYQLEEDCRLIEKIVNDEAAVKLFDWIESKHLDEVYTTVYDSSFLQLNDTTAPKLMESLSQSCEMFGLKEVPKVYVIRDFDDSIRIDGIAEPFLVIGDRYLRMLEREDPRLRLGVLSAQVGGIQAGHHRGLILSWIISFVTPWIPLPKTVKMVLLKGLEATLNDWKRCRMYTCDRAMYLAVEDLPIALRGILAGTAPDSILDEMGIGTRNDVYKSQVKRFMENGLLDGLINTASSFMTDTSWLPPRYQALEKFAKNERMTENGC